ncbi:MAG: hypothetical protein H6Q38_3176 [Chloroflexi bacterium]|nr:hypothetical protein [Chloroflexota bacterium]
MKNLGLSKNWLYIPLLLMAIFYLLPLYVMLVTGFICRDRLEDNVEPATGDCL